MSESIYEECLKQAEAASLGSIDNSTSATLFLLQCSIERLEAAQKDQYVSVDMISESILKADQLLEQAQQTSRDLTSWMLILCGALVFFMQAGFAMLCAGNVRVENTHVSYEIVQNSMSAVEKKPY